MAPSSSGDGGIVSPQGVVHRRLLLHVHGFDPRGPAVIHSIQKEDAPRETMRPDRNVLIGRRRRQSFASAWTVNTAWPEAEVETEFVALRWDDLIRTRWDRTLKGQAAGLARWFWRYFQTGALSALVRGSRTLMIGVLALPLAVAAFLAASIVVIGLAGIGVAVVALRLGLSPWFGLLAMALIAILPKAWRRFDAWANVCWLGRGHLHMLEVSQNAIVGLEERIQHFTRRLLEEADNKDWDEILVVGHSSGSLHAVAMLGQALRTRPDLGVNGPRVGLITLAHCIPGYAILGPRPIYNDGLDALVAARQVRWVDITGPADPGAGGAWSPLKHSPHEASGRVEIRPPHFHRALEPEAFRALKRDPMAYHFQYLRSSDHVDVYDWYRLAFGPDALSP